ncbi:hypothetical protein BH10PSE16_BH10PSE16_37330 [soil metagenome]
MVMKSAIKTIPLATTALIAASMFGAVAHAQTAAGTAAAPPTRAEVKMEAADFLATHRWDDDMSAWVLKSGVEAPAGVKSRAEVKAERDAFLRANRWDNNTSSWVPLKPGPRDLGMMTRAQLAAETRQFLATHTFDEDKGSYVERMPRKMP